MIDKATSRVVIATANPGKVAEFRALLAGSGLQLVTPNELGIEADVVESGTTYLENARLKAQAYADLASMPALADDSGIEVDALDGQPGLHSARYGGPGLSDRDRSALLLERLAAVPNAQRNARFRCVLVFYEPGGRAWTAVGTCEGVIARSPRGANGFGYDPLFLFPQLGRTMAELADAEKNKISHRAHATQALLAQLSIPSEVEGTR